ncbi:hypothetical protein F0562_002166 [Nyssa sinensis]|uniref:Uncharacterized protein n=1 Tax=Nyssa sinensis TaxID=561372 RepID=A0A5J5C8X7_9ASTE|nr:hypothetical protein F0562_002166 [Nyssa sinensis]
MWRSCCILLKRSVSWAARCKPKPLGGLRGCWEPKQYCGCTCASRLMSSLSSNSSSTAGGGVVGGDGESMSFSEAKKLMRLVNVEALKMKLGMEGKEVIGYSELLKACESMGVAKSLDEAAAFARVLDEAGVVLLFRDKVYLHPDKVVDLVRKAVPLALTSEDDPRKDELKRLQERKEVIDIAGT